MAQYGFHIDLNACIGCKACQMACKDRANNEVGTNWRRVVEYGGGEWTKVGNAWQHNIFTYFVPTACHHCSNPPCLPVCPTAAIVKDDNGIVKIDVDPADAHGDESYRARCARRNCSRISTSTGYDRWPRALRGEIHSIAATSLLGTKPDARMASSVASAAQ